MLQFSAKKSNKIWQLHHIQRPLDMYCAFQIKHPVRTDNYYKPCKMQCLWCFITKFLPLRTISFYFEYNQPYDSK